ncbi:hypothetical protein [Bacillus sp. FSL K6-3431]|uniref:hypothetical protein n=1 Tax=Bacillus sp. FSL K6-3431 TaxID=2921500 RepID=UPI0030FAE4AE
MLRKFFMLFKDKSESEIPFFYEDHSELDEEDEDEDEDEDEHEFEDTYYYH